MADATCSQSSMREVEDMLRSLVEQRISAVEQQIGGLQELMRGLSIQFTEVVNPHWDRGVRAKMQQDYHISTRCIKVDFSKFTREDVTGWVSKCERFFLLDGTPDERKAVLASLSMDEQS